MSSPPTPPVTPVVLVPSHFVPHGVHLAWAWGLLILCFMPRACALRLDPRCSDRWNVASRACLQAAKRMPREAFTLTNSLLGPPGLSLAWQLVERRWHLNCGLGQLNSSGSQVHTRCHVAMAFSSVRTVILSVSIWISHFG